MNYGNHLGNDTVLSLAHELRVRFLHSYEQSELSFFGHGIIMSDSAIQYRGQGFWGQEVQGELWFEASGMTRFDLYYRLFENTGQGPRDIAYVKTGQVLFDYENQKIATRSKQYQSFVEEIL